ncbi:hypothetical protein H8K32_19650 [Undibacterium jejuense]|uniref:Uncharacterized protein n=1 Tax=Undibacterium jejuense TaxID=1344949 RepID=A0A923HL79_9BURK|nr:hypothetical protein [Undibacterium jejuense]MBC3864320.1 hypothetical protein [Undibacterium jejuense]
MKVKILSYAVLMTLLISGCSKQASVSTESVQNTGFKGEFSQSSTDSQTAGKVQRTTRKQQLLTALIDAAQKTQSEYETYFPKFSDDEVKKHKAGFDASGDIRDRLIEWGYTKNPFDQTAFSDNTGMREITKLIKLPNKIDDWFLPLDEKAQKYVNDGNVQAGHDFLLRYWTLQLFNWSVQPSTGWPDIEGLNRNDAQERWIIISMRRIRFANLFTSEISRIMPTVHKNPTEFRNDFVVALNKMSNETLYQIFAQAKSQANDDMKEPLTIDGVTGRGTSWVVGTKEYNGQMAGWTFKIGGQPVFGNGYIDGQLVESELASSLELSSKIDRAIKRSGTVGTDENAKGSVKAE